MTRDGVGFRPAPFSLQELLFTKLLVQASALHNLAAYPKYCRATATSAWLHQEFAIASAILFTLDISAK
jgi:hypothetical protein